MGRRLACHLASPGSGNLRVAAGFASAPGSASWMADRSCWEARAQDPSGFWEMLLRLSRSLFRIRLEPGTGRGGRDVVGEVHTLRFLHLRGPGSARSTELCRCPQPCAPLTAGAAAGTVCGGWYLVGAPSWRVLRGLCSMYGA